MCFTTFAVAYMLILKLVGDIKTPYEGYPAPALGVYGWALVAILPVIAFVLYKNDALSKKEA